MPTMALHVRSMARRRSPPKLKEESLRIRISAEEKRVMVAAADREGLTLSAWMRRTALQAAGFLPRART